MNHGEAVKEPPSLEDLLSRRGIHKSDGFDDYQDFIEERQRNGLVARLVRLPRIFVQGSMHLALGQVVNTKRFWTWGDRR